MLATAPGSERGNLIAVIVLDLKTVRREHLMARTPEEYTRPEDDGKILLSRISSDIRAIARSGVP